MLHLKFALNLESLADEMIEAISKAWKNPFEAPVVVFPDPKLEQWFRLKWVQKKNVVAGFNSMMIDKFLLEILVGDDTRKKKLSADMLCNVILAYLKMQDGGTYNYEKLGNEVLRYLIAEDANGKSVLDETHLFDFATKMATLFLDYETSRPRDFIKNADGSDASGILDKWKQGNLQPFFAARNGDVATREKWQQKLYSAIFHSHDGEDSLLTRVFKKEAERKKDDVITYLTIPFLYYSCFDKNGKAKFHLEKIQDRPLFVFGLSGMGQFYRVILHKFAENHDIYAYIQNPCMEFWEDLSRNTLHHNWKSKGGEWKDKAGNNLDDIKRRMNVNLQESSVTDPDDISEYTNPAEEEAENSLLCTWGKSGRENIKLWCQAANYDFDFEVGGATAIAASDLPQDTLLHKLQYAIANRINKVEANNTDAGTTDATATAATAAVNAAAASPAAKSASTAANTAAINGASATATVNAAATSPAAFAAAKPAANASAVAAVNCDDTSLTVSAAPTKIREMEALHSRICKLMQKGARVNEILVVSPDLDSYRTAIKTVFDQTPERPSGEKCDSSLHVPFSIVDSPAHSSLTEQAIRDLFVILNGKTISRPQFFSLMRNPVVQNTRGIKEEYIDSWETWIEETNVYRNRESKKQDWTYGARRLLLAKMTKNLSKFTGDGDALKPYSDMATSNNASLCRFIEAINDLNDWIAFGSQDGIADLNKLSDHLNAWLAMANSADSLAGESVVYKRVNESVENLRYQLDTGIETISWKIIEQSLITAAQGSAYSCGNLFVNGITFMNFIPNRIIPVKHLFFIGGDSINFPGAKQQNTLDLRKSCRPWPGDDSPIAKRRYAFLSQLMSVSESFHISYVDQDIKKDAELYPTSVVNDIQKFLEKNHIEWKKEKISLDETRDTSELFTPKSLRNKKAYVDMIHNGNAHAHTNLKIRGDESTDAKNITIKIPERVSLFQLRKFLEDPFEFRIGLMMMEKDEDDPEKELFEPIYFDRLEESKLLKMMLAAELSGKEDELEKFKRDSKLKGKMPDKIFGDKIWNELNVMKNVILMQMGEKAKEIRESWTYKDRLQDLQLLRGDGTKWNLSGTMDWCNSKELSDVTEIISETTSSAAADKIKLSKYAGPYIKALALLALKCEKHPESKSKKQTIGISIYSCDMGLGGPATTAISLSPEKAKQMLEQIYNEAYGCLAQKKMPYSKAVPADLFDSIKESDDIYSYRQKLLDGPWKYFGKKTLFDPAKDVGFDAEKFQEQWAEACAKMKSLMQIEPYEKPAKEKGAEKNAEKSAAKTAEKKPAKKKKEA